MFRVHAGFLHVDFQFGAGLLLLAGEIRERAGFPTGAADDGAFGVPFFFRGLWRVVQESGVVLHIGDALADLGGPACSYWLQEPGFQFADATVFASESLRVGFADALHSLCGAEETSVRSANLQLSWNVGIQINLEILPG